MRYFVVCKAMKQARTKNFSIMKREFIIWGIPKGQDEEIILMSKFDGEPIMYYGLAENLASLLRHKYHCRGVRIQEIDLTDNEIDFKHTINI